MNAVCAADVPAVWTILFSQRLKLRNKRPSERYPKNAATTETFGPNPSLRTMYGYDAPITTATTMPATTARKVNSRVPGGRAILSAICCLSDILPSRVSETLPDLRQNFVLGPGHLAAHLDGTPPFSKKWMTECTTKFSGTAVCA